MKTNLFQKLLLVFVLILAASSAMEAQIPTVTFKSGSYRGTMQVTTSIEGVAETTSMMKVKGRSEGDSTLKFMGAPQIANHIFAGNEAATAVYLFEFSGIVNSMVFSERANYDTSSASRAPESLLLKGNSVRADLTFTRSQGSDEVTFTIKIRLTRVGN
jgi:hypothetical protein